MAVDLSKLGVANPKATPRYADLAKAPSDEWRPGKKLYLSKFPPVPMSPELTRVLELPRRTQLDLESPRARDIASMMTDRWTRGNRACACARIDPKIASGKKQCPRTLKPVQAWALYELGIVGGLLGSLPIGSGKCLAAETEVFDYKTGRRRMLHESGTLEIATFQQTLSIRNASAFPSGLKSCLKISLRDGSAIIASKDHQILTARGWARAAELTADDFVAVAGLMPEPAHPLIVSDDIVKFLAYMLSDGGCSQDTMSFTNADEAIIMDWKAASEQLGYRVAENAQKSKAQNFSLRTGVWKKGKRSALYDACRACFRTDKKHSCRGLCRQCYQKYSQKELSNYPLQKITDPFRRRWNLYGLAKEKRLHADLWALPSPQVALFLNRFWACDGHVSKLELEITLASEKMIDDLRFLMLRLGIRSRKRYKVAQYTKAGVTKYFDAWRVSLSGQDALIFLNRVGNVLGKEKACQALRSRLERTRRNTNCDIVPIGPAESYEICDEIAPPGGRTEIMRHWLTEVKDQYISRSRFCRFVDHYGYQGKYSHLATSDVVWERVATLEDCGIRPVYDLSVPETHNFVANGIIVHNSYADLLAPLALEPLGLKHGLLLVPPTLLEQLERDYLLAAEHYRVPGLYIHGLERRYDVPNAPKLHVLPYSRLSLPTSSNWIRNLRPEFIIADECDRLRDPAGAGSSRVLRYFSEYGDTRFAGWTGSLTEQSITEYAHLAALALRHQSPLPLDKAVVADWARALDESENPAPPGELGRLCGEDLDPENTDDVREGFRRRLAETLGVVVSTAASVDVDVVIEERLVGPIPAVVEEALDRVRTCWVRPDTLAGSEHDEELVDAMQVAKCARELASGIFYRWRFPPIRGVPQRKTDIDEWFDARKDWNRELRRKLASRDEWLDSPHLCEHAAQRFHGDRPQRDDRPEWDSSAWPRWRDVKDKIMHETEAVRVSDYLVVDAATWALQHRGIVWYGMAEFGKWVAEMSGLPLHGGGPGSGSRIDKETGDRSIVASIKSHGRGRDGLQSLFCEQLIAQVPASATGWEQVVGRTARQGQNSPVVKVWYYGQTPELKDAFETAWRRAEYVRGTTGAQPLLLRSREP